MPWPFLNYTDKDQKDEVTWQKLSVGRGKGGLMFMLLEESSTPPPPGPAQKMLQLGNEGQN